MKTSVLSVKGTEFKRVATQAGKFLREGKLVAFPTETVYGLGVSLDRPEAVERLYRVKGRPPGKELTLAIADQNVLQKYDIFLSPLAKRLVERFWPGPLTLILKNEKGERVGVRMPGHPLAREVIREARVPIGLPSANPSGKNPPRSAEEVIAYFDGVIDLIVDGGQTMHGVSSTIVDLSGGKVEIVREGAISRKEIEKICCG